MSDDAAGNFYRSVGNHRLLTAQEERDLARRIRAGGEDGAAAKQELMLHNMRLVMDMAIKFRGRGLPYDALVQEGTIGLGRAADKFDPARECRFSTVAYWWIRQALQRAFLTTEEGIQVPGQVTRILLTAHNNPDMSVDEIAKAVKTTAVQVRAAKRAAVVTRSLDATWQDSNDEHEDIEDKFSDNPAEAYERTANMEWVCELLTTLPDDEREVVELMFGLNGYSGKEHTRKEVAEVMGMPVGAVITLHSNALKHLREAVS